MPGVPAEARCVNRAQRVGQRGTLAGGALVLLAVRRGGRFTAPFIGCWTALYAGGITTIIVLV